MGKTKNEPVPQRPLLPGTITRLEGQKRNPQRVSVFIGGEFAFGVHVDLVVEFGLYRGQSLTVEEQQRIREADHARAARETALAYLGYRARTEHEVRQKLIRSGFDEGVITQTVTRLRELGYLDDAAYARRYVQARFQNRGYGPQRLRRELVQRGLPPALLDPVLDELLGEEDTLAAARQHAEKRWPRLAAEADVRKRRKKLADYLLRRGFSYETARRVVEELERREEES